MDWRTSVSAIPSGNAGNRQTLVAMSRLAREGSVDPVVIRAAQDAVRPFPERTPDADFDAILADVRRRMRYTHDPLGAEVVKAPRYVIDSTNNSAFPEPMDCDDASVLTTSMLGAIGYHSKFVTVAVDPARPDEWSHVYVAALHPTRKEWVALDPIVREFRAGDEVPEAQLTAPRAYHEGVDPMMRGLGCGAQTVGVQAGMTGLGYAARGMGDAASEKASGNPYYNDPSTWDYGTAPGASSGGGVEAWADKLLAAGTGIFSSQTKTAQANAAARIAEANARAARLSRGLPATPGLFTNADGSTNMTNVVIAVGVVGVIGLAIMKASRRR